jgi:V8-like Glu-specific endopeptidase
MKYLILLTLFSQVSTAAVQSVCDKDDRVPTHDLRIGRLRMSDWESSCTVTMISKTCAISAGHCGGQFKNKVEFDVPMSQSIRLIPAAAKNTYEIDPTSIVSRNEGEGNDWAVLKIRANPITKKFPGEVAGFYPVSLTLPQVGEEISIAGYGRDDRRELNTNGTLQIASGPIQSITKNVYGTPEQFLIMIYKVDSMPGDSGASIVRVKEQDIVGVHTTGGACREETGNMGTIIGANKNFRTAIQNCLGSEL